MAIGSEDDADPKSTHLLHKLRLQQLDRYSKVKAPLPVSFSVYGATFFVILTSGVAMASSGYFTPGHTNSFSMIGSLLSQIVVVLGCGGLTGLRYAKFSVMPAVTKKMGEETVARQLAFTLT